MNSTDHRTGYRGARALVCVLCLCLAGSAGAADDRRPAAVTPIILEMAGPLAEAVATYRQALAAEPGRVSVMLKLARVTAKSEPQQAIELIEGALRAQASAPQSFDPELFLTSISELAESPEVEALLESALELAPANGAIAYRLGTSLEANGGDAQRVVRLATRAIRFQVATDEATALRDRAKARL